VKEWRPPAERGKAAAQVVRGYIYQYGQGVSRDDAEAVKWYRLAAAQGDAEAQSSLGNMVSTAALSHPSEWRKVTVVALTCQ
jgi:uncharacterized protein